MADNFKPGDHYIIDDRSGLKIRASEAKKEWTGQIVHKDDWESRQPQDLVRSVRDDMSVRDPRPRTPDVFIGPLTTLLAATAEAGASSLTLESAVRMQAEDRISIILDNGDAFLTTISSVTDGTHIVTSTPLPWRASTGNPVVDNTAVANPEIG